MKKQILETTVVEVKDGNRQVFSCHVQQVTEKIIVLVVSDVETKYMRRDSGTTYSSKDTSNWVIPAICLKHIEEFMVSQKKAKWHSGWHPMKNNKPASSIEEFEVISFLASEEDLNSPDSFRLEVKPAKISSKKEKKQFVAKNPVQDEVFDDFENDVKAPKPKRFKESNDFEDNSIGDDNEFEESAEPSDEFDEFSDFDNKETLGSGIDDMF